MQELVKQFALSNHKTVIILDVEPLNIDVDGKTKKELDTFGATTVHSNKDQSVNEGYMFSLAPNFHEDTKKLINDIYKRGESPILIRLSEEELEKAETDPYSLANIALALVHELAAHAIKDKDGIQRDAGPQHASFYNDPNWNGPDSPEYSLVRGDSDAGRYQQRIEKAAKELGLDRPQPKGGKKKQNVKETITIGPLTPGEKVQ